MDVGILTFHCVNNVGALLQAYGLKRYLADQGAQAEIIPYEPPFLTGHVGPFPYVQPRVLLRNFWYVSKVLNGLKNFYRREKPLASAGGSMAAFQREFLLEGNRKKIRSFWGLGRADCQILLAGSDQIWNPEITYGLRRAYFGAFRNRHIRKAVSYAASLGRTELPQKYEKEFSRLLTHVDAVSLREAGAVPFVRRMGREARAVLDPVFLPGRAVWEEIEKPPERAGFILLYQVQGNPEMVALAERLSREKGLPVVQLQAYGDFENGFEVDRAAGPREFLGYLHRADYVVTNSFHGVAFSLIYEKRFAAFSHSRYGARIQSVLEAFGLEGRLFPVGTDVDAPIDWRAAWEKGGESVRASKAFLEREVLRGLG